MRHDVFVSTPPFPERPHRAVNKDEDLDCVEMKRTIQTQMLEERRTLGDAEFERRHREWLETSSDPLARWWRSRVAKLDPTEVRERPEPQSSSMGRTSFCSPSGSR